MNILCFGYKTILFDDLYLFIYKKLKKKKKVKIINNKIKLK
jgi:uncharacterized protein YjhX (UPF0386 family)